MAHVSDLVPDPRNARKHGERNIRTIVKALEEVGAARSIVIDENNTILAGNGLVEAAGIAGIENVKIVEVDGSTIVAVKRTGLNKKQKQRLALFDNRAGELAEWDAETLSDLVDEEFDFSNLFNENELALLTGNLELPDDPRELWQDAVDMGTEAKAHRQLTIYFKEAVGVEAFSALLEQTITDDTKSLWYPAKKD